MKYLILILAFALTSQTSTAQTNFQCPETVTENTYTEYITFLDTHRDNLKKVRQWARLNKRAEIEKTSNSLEYWSKDVKRYIVKYKNSHPSKVCERVFNTESKQMRDFFYLALMYTNMPNLAPVNHLNYN